MRPTFSISLHKDAESSEPITPTNLKLGEVVFFSLTWSNKENQQVEFFAKDCKIIDGATEVNIISDTCVAGVVETKRYDLKFLSPKLSDRNQKFRLLRVLTTGHPPIC